MAKQAMTIVTTVCFRDNQLETYEIYEVVQEVKDLVVGGERNAAHLARTRA